MRYTKEDFEIDYRYSSVQQADGEQQSEDEHMLLGEESMVEIAHSEYEDEILRLNTVLRVDDYKRTPYSIHMSYPTARALYTIQLYMVKQDYLIYKNRWGQDRAMAWFEDARCRLQPKEGDILIELLPFTDDHYPCIYKTLQNLEVGHLLYNIGLLAEQYGCSYLVDNSFPNVALLRQERIAREQARDPERIVRFWKQAILRSSGKYYGGLINFDSDHEMYRYIPKEINRMHAVQFYNEPKELVKTVLLTNDGNAYVNEEYKISCDYVTLTKEYRYVNFRTQSQLLLIMMKWPEQWYENYADLIQYIGMVAQEICIENSQKDVYNRPIKQVLHPFWGPILKQCSSLQDYIPFYGVITGKDSVCQSPYQQIV